MKSIRWVCALEYDGSKYYGWQKQPGLATIQGILEMALSKIANHTVSCYAAGRTDKGVHAREMTIHFDTESERTKQVWHRALNSLLPSDIRCLWLELAPDGFHARHSAIARTYEYKICTNKLFQPVMSRNYSWWFPYNFCMDSLVRAACIFHGEHDFSGYRGRDCQAKSTIKKLEPIKITSQDDIITIEITGNAFLHHMVRNIVGALMLISQEKKDVAWLKTTLTAKQRVQEIPMAPAHGLMFVKAHYLNQNNNSKNKFI